MRCMCQAVLAVALGTLSSAYATTHRLTVAAHPGLLVTNEEVDEIIAEMNQIIAARAYQWDEACGEIKFARDGNVVQNNTLLDSGTFPALASSLRTSAPTAQVLIVRSINCSGIAAAGCGPIGAEPMIVGQAPDFDAQLWLHERGHNVGLKHSAEGPGLADTVHESIGQRFMFWMLGLGHTGKTRAECDAFFNASFASVDKGSEGGVPDAAVLPPAAVPAMPLAATAGSERTSPKFLKVADAFPPPVGQALGNQATGVPLEARLAVAAKKANLTPQAYKVIGAPWVDGAPTEAIKQLSQDDLESIREMLKGSPNQYWPQAIGVLGIAGSDADVSLINSALNLPMPALSQQPDRESVRALRNLIRVKLAAPLALGVLANRTKSPQAVDILKQTANPAASAALVGPDTATTMSKSALNALSVADTPESKNYLESVFKLQQSGALGEAITKSNLEAVRAVPISPPEVLDLRKNSFEVRQKGIDAFIQGPGRL